jgi:hypothetical protein
LPLVQTLAGDPGDASKLGAELSLPSDHQSGVGGKRVAQHLQQRTGCGRQGALAIGHHDDDLLATLGSLVEGDEHVVEGERMGGQGGREGADYGLGTVPVPIVVSQEREAEPGLGGQGIRAGDGAIVGGPLAQEQALMMGGAQEVAASLVV